MQILFSVIIPSYNRAAILGQTIESVLSQVYTNWELLIVDDGSSDNTQSVVEGYKNQKIIYIKKENGGVCSARNLGVHSAKGEFIVFLDSDDTITDDCLLHFNEAIKNDTYPDIISGGMKKIDVNSKNAVLVKPFEKGRGAIGWAVIAPGSFAVRKDFLLKTGLYDENISYGENLELFLRFKKHNPSVVYTDCFDLTYYSSVDGGSKNLLNMINSNKLILEKHDDILSTNTKYLFNQIIGVNYMRFKEGKKASKYFLKAIKYKPFRFDTYLRLIISKSNFLMSFFYK
ncbi:MAG: glycosyltransferase family A protein [Bacteroidota bacterium]